MESYMHMGPRNQPKDKPPRPPSQSPSLLGPPIAHQLLHQDTPGHTLYKSGNLALTTPQAQKLKGNR